MCSKTSSVSYGNREDDDNYSSLCPKKQKHNNGGKKRVPRRGPGVAELEKIRLGEQHISTAAPFTLHHPPSLEKSPTITDRTGLVYPFSSYFSAGSFPSDLIPPAPVFQRKHDSSLHYLPPMNLPKQGSGGFYQFIEPPSSQTSSLDNVTKFLDEEKISSAKRPWHFMADTAKCSVGPSTTISRDAKQTRSLDLRLKNHVQDSGTTIRNPITIDSPSSASPPTTIFANPSLGFPRFLQKEEDDHEIIQRKSGTNFPLNKKPFYSFLPANDQIIRDQDRSFSLRTERYDTVPDHGIDLRLKL
ncbi:verprolin [Arabidopsis thaliana]|uniref:Protein SPEAR4 n=1 Tax=Arabidopsis thaliana TaxID=3702 RepID=SPER4_ARATH|nr:verprolin [Arabidopsis thaliana]Q9SHQ9.1 RecName: Full=Protein SPEAR4; AltName: Full=SPL-like, EAR-containing protein 4; AltName: Full=TCP interactor containing EAR motif protein 3 [Arabidopsis thaliana]AAF24558.1 F1K23.3 [Arabidopsis thaliana]ABE65669.1 unknown [Arabidopsis thaliana]AEE31028.1 verprolin [Arabidopsis thaliana]|eukprot:NP_174196.2 verprolin [Arabidopsis thaliana]